MTAVGGSGRQFCCYTRTENMAAFRVVCTEHYAYACRMSGSNSSFFTNSAHAHVLHSQQE
jgi:hypothetical protein